jgi:hypothetical protein
MTRKTLGVERVAFHGITRRQEALLMFVAKPRIADEVGMLGDPKDVFGREVVPAMRAGDPGLQGSASGQTLLSLQRKATLQTTLALSQRPPGA